MAFQVSPGVQVREIDLTNVVPAVSSSIGAFAGNFTWGPIEEITDISSEKQLAETFGVPTTSNSADFFTAASFLKYSSALRVVRIPNAAYKNAANGATAPLIKNATNYDNTFTAVGTNDGNFFAAKYAGTLGNSLKVSVCAAAATTAAFESWTYKALFDTAPGTSDYVNDLGGSRDEVHVVVVDEDGAWSGIAGTVLEKFAYLSVATGAKNDDGSTNYYREVLNQQSKYIWWLDHPTEFTNAGSAGTTTFTNTDPQIDYSLTGGVDATSTTPANIQSGYALFNDATAVDVNLLIGPVLPTTLADATSVANYVLGIATSRQDCIATISPYVAATVGNADPKAAVIAFAETLTGTSYGVVDSTAVKMYDKYNDAYINVPASGHVAGLCARTDASADPWFSPAGLTRGQLLGITRLAFNPTQLQRDDLYKKRVNPIVSFPGEGTILFGDRTLLAKPSAFDRINVRRLFIVLEKAISTAARAQLFEFNDEFTRAMFRNMVEPFLRDVKGRRGVTDFKVVCDDTNNTSDIIDSNQFVGDIYIKPNRSINFITLNFIATRSGVDFNEIGG
jgi:phage tail sheath protein FI